MNVFTLEIDGQPVMVFDATGIEEAQGICALPEFRSDLEGVRRQGKPLFTEAATFVARDATAVEVAAFNHAVAGADPSEGPTMAFLVPVDGMVVTIVQPE